MPDLRVTIVNACLRDGAGGSPTAVLEETGLSDEERCRIPVAMGTSHAVFVEPGEPVSLRFFTATGELPACGHGTVAALVYLATRGGATDPEADSLPPRDGASEPQADPASTRDGAAEGKAERLTGPDDAAETEVGHLTGLDGAAAANAGRVTGRDGVAESEGGAFAAWGETAEREVALRTSGRSFSGWVGWENGRFSATFDPGPVDVREPGEHEAVLRALGVGPEILAAGVRVASVGRERLLVPVVSRAALDGLTPDFESLRDACDQAGLLG